MNEGEFDIFMTQLYPYRGNFRWKKKQNSFGDNKKKRSKLHKNKCKIDKRNLFLFLKLHMKTDVSMYFLFPLSAAGRAALY